MGSKILTWLGIIGGGLAVLGGIGFVMTLYINAAVAKAVETAKPPAVIAIEADIGLIRNDINHMVTDIAENRRVSEDTNRIFREYLQVQAN